MSESLNFSQIAWHHSYGEIVDHFLNNDQPILLVEEVPGSGASIFARRLASLLGKDAPFRSPHHTISLVGMKGTLGEGMTYRKGELALAADGVLYLDDPPMFRSDIINAVKNAHGSGFINFGAAAFTFGEQKVPKIVASIHMKLFSSPSSMYKALTECIRRLEAVPFYFETLPYHITSTMSNGQLLEKYKR